ncbi:MAG TPA: MotA/TolQ/ExbB proton channel family protein [Phycisphaerae bacterium]|nr:MotA/TolQ/ExbB proton channel family protein [Phycisphaerae bacterium]
MNSNESPNLLMKQSTLKYFRLIALLVVAITLGFATQSFAADGETESIGTVSRIFDHFVKRGGYITWFILIPMSLATIALIVEHSISIRRERILPDRTIAQIREKLESRRFVDGLRYTEHDPSVISVAINSSLHQAENGYAAMQGAMLDSVEQQADRMMRKIEYLNVIGNVSPMVGLFGTVYGMIRLFASIREAGGIPEPARIADDISIALVTTFWGLMVAIPALTLFAFFRNRIDELTTECANKGNKLISIFEPSANPPISRPVAQGPPRAVSVPQQSPTI